ncbi:MAG: UDP-galactopyranose mutase [Desulfovibrio sp.]|jgi:UDP-galactopyranose mutase|nr:UDP-galactopyranose mutase [Desulfovibrio sp.]
MDLSGVRCLVVGAGFWGATLAERIAAGLGQRVLVADRRGHPGGNCYSRKDEETGIEAHVYGTHVFHTKNARVWEYVNRFGGFSGYRHRVWTEHQGRVYPLPISLATLNSFYGLNLRPAEAAAFIAGEAARDGVREPSNLEEKAVSLLGRPLYEALIQGYTRKQWNRDPRELPPSIITRLPVRSSYNTDYFDDPWQGLPLDGYAALISRMLAHPLIDLCLGVSYADIAGQIPADCRVFYSGPVDELFRFSLGALEWRSLRFEWSVEPVADFQGCPVLNQADADIPFTRTHEFKHLHPERGPQGEKTLLAREYPLNFVPGGEPFYPVNTPANEALLAAYREKLRHFPRLTLGGRLGSYRYLDMDAAIEAALACFDALREEGPAGKPWRERP